MYKKLAVVGSRFEEKSKEEIELSKKITKIIFNILDKFYNKYNPNLLISGGAKGVDTKSFNWAVGKDLSTYIIRPNWYPNGKDKPIDKSAGFIRNKLIIEAADFVIAFTTGSNGTANSISWAQKFKKPLCIFNFDGKLILKDNI